MTSGDRSSEKGWHSILWTSMVDRGRTWPSPSVWVHVWAHCVFFVFLWVCTPWPFQRLAPGVDHRSIDPLDSGANHGIPRGFSLRWLWQSFLHIQYFSKEIHVAFRCRRKYSFSFSFLWFVTTLSKTLTLATVISSQRRTHRIWGLSSLSKPDWNLIWDHPITAGEAGGSWEAGWRAADDSDKPRGWISPLFTFNMLRPLCSC